MAALTRIIDAHIHIWDLERIEYTWLKGDTSILNRTYSLAEFPATNITGGILVQAANNREDTDMMLEVAAKTELIQGVVGWLPLTDPVATARLLEEKYAKHPLFKGCRHLIHNEKDPRWLLQPTVLESLAVLASYGLPYDVVGVNITHLQTAVELAQKLPQLHLVLDHLNQPPVASGTLGEWGQWIKRAADQQNVHAKISGLGTAAAKGADWSPEDIKPYILFALEHFGTHRCFCGGDWPVSLLAGSYNKIWDAYRSILAKALQDEEQDKVLYRNASLFYKLQ